MGQSSGHPCLGAPASMWRLGASVIVVFLCASLSACEVPTTETQLSRCQSGDDNDACFELGMAAYNRPLPDVNGARRLFSKACNVHHAQSCNGLAEMVRDAKGGPRDPKRAAELFDIACRGEITTACVNLGLALYSGDGVRKDEVRAVGLFKTTCGAEPIQPEACSALGIAYEEGLGVDGMDLDIAERLQRKACDEDHPLGCVRVGMLYRARSASTASKKIENMTIAVDFLNKACRLDASSGCFELAEMHRDKLAPEPSDSKAALFFQKVCQVDPTRGCFEAAKLMESGRVRARENEIESLYNLACEHGRTEACSKRSLAED
jgi:uncharacterized protein